MNNRPKKFLTDWTLIPLRLVIGCGFIVHGWAKWSRGPAGFGHLLDQIGIPFPQVTAWLVTLLEICGGFAILAGAFVALFSIPLIFSMLVAMFTVHLKYGFSSINTIGLTPSGPVFGPPGYEIDLLYIAGLVVLLVNGAGTMSFDRILANAIAECCGCKDSPTAPTNPQTQTHLCQ